MPLYLAAMKGHIEVVKLLLDKGADISVASTNGWTPLNAAADSGLLAIALSTPIRSLLNLPPARHLALQFLPSQIFEDGPIIHMIIIEALAHEEITEDFA